MQRKHGRCCKRAFTWREYATMEEAKRAIDHRDWLR